MNKKSPFCILSFFILLSFLLFGCTDNNILSNNLDSSNSQLSVSFIDVGQGDSTLIQCGSSSMLIDAAEYSERYTVSNHLKEQGVNKLDYLVATHPHSDHIGGMTEVIYNFDVGTFVTPKTDIESKSFNYVLDAVDEKNLPYLNPYPGDTFSLGDATVTVLSPAKGAYYGDDANNYSLVLKLEYKEVSFLFMGDAEKEIEEEILYSGYNVDADVLKCGHHGSSTSSSKAFINAVSPSAAVISCGKGNDYGHPHDETLKTLNSKNIKIFRTDESSTIVAYSDGQTITFSDSTGTISTVNPDSAQNTTQTSAQGAYIGNKNSKTFHTPDCSSASKMKDKNKVYFNSRQEAVDNNYSPCGSCNP